MVLTSPVYILCFILWKLNIFCNQNYVDSYHIEFYIVIWRQILYLKLLLGNFFYQMINKLFCAGKNCTQIVHNNSESNIDKYWELHSYWK